jgi:hypothetical protein
LKVLVLPFSAVTGLPAGGSLFTTGGWFTSVTDTFHVWAGGVGPAADANGHWPRSAGGGKVGRVLPRRMAARVAHHFVVEEPLDVRSTSTRIGELHGEALRRALGDGDVGLARLGGGDRCDRGLGRHGVDGFDPWWDVRDLERRHIDFPRPRLLRSAAAIHLHR